jgi:DNA-binding MarR family transcriptional regulator
VKSHNDDLYPVAIEIQLYAALLLKFFDQALQERLREHGSRISSLQHAVLRMLQFETLTISDISQRLGLDPSTLVRAVDVLERRKLAQRGSDPLDRRRHPITITGEGRALVAAVPAISVEDDAFQALRALGGTPAKELRNLLQKLIQRFPEGREVVGQMAGLAHEPHS